MTNAQVTFSSSHQVRSDVALAAHPTDSTRVVLAARKQPDFAVATCTVTVLYSTNSGTDWTEASALALPPGASAVLAPSLTWDATGNVVLAVSALSSSSGSVGTGIYVYRSSNGGASWSAPALVAVGSEFPALAFDPILNRLYLAGRARDGFAQHIFFASSADSGLTWAVAMSGGQPKQLDSGNHYPLSPPALAVGAGPTAGHSTLLVTFYIDGSIFYLRSSDGGLTFAGPNHLAGSALGGNTHTPPGLSGANQFTNEQDFLTAPTCAARGSSFVIAWTMFPLNQIFCAVSTLPGALNFTVSQLTSDLSAFCYNPRPCCAPDGTIGCAYYRASASGRADVMYAVVNDPSTAVTVTDHPWDPQLGAFHPAGVYETQFILEPFGFAADASDILRLVWPDTRTGIRELWTEQLLTSGTRYHHISKLDPYFAELVRIFGGITYDGGGFTLPGGPVPPYGPPDGLLLAATAYQLAGRLNDKRGVALQHRALLALQGLVNQELSTHGLTSTKARAAET